MRKKWRMQKRILALVMAAWMACGAVLPSGGNLLQLSVVTAESDNPVEVDGSSMKNKYIDLVVSDTGRFVMGTVDGNPSLDTDNYKKMLYGYGENKFTSYSTVRVDGETYVYGDDGLSSGPSFDADAKNNTSSQNIGGIEIKQTLSFINNISTDREDVVEIKYEVVNTDSSPHNAGMRILLDTMLGGNDDAPFRVEGTGAVTTETEYTGNKIPQYWQAFDDLRNPSVISQGTFMRGDDLRPDKVQFVNWGGYNDRGGAYETPWDYRVTNGKDNGDSAVTITWNEKELAAGESRTYKTYYGLSDLIQDLKPPLALSVYGDNTATLKKTESADGSIFNPLSITAYVENIGDGPAQNAYVKIELPEGMSLAATGQAIYTFPTIDKEELKQVSWKVDISNTIAAGTHTIKVICGADGIEEKVVKKDITIPNHEATEDVRDNRILWGEEKKNWKGEGTGEWTGQDNLGFINCKDDFIHRNIWGQPKDGYDSYVISDEYFDLLTKNMSYTVYRYLQKKRKGENGWKGSCYGMSNVVALMKSGYLTTDYWKNDKQKVSCVHDLKAPKDSEKIENLVNFYQLSQYLPDCKDMSDTFLNRSDESLLLKQLVKDAKKVKTGGLPVQVNFFWKYRADYHGDIKVPDNFSADIELSVYQGLLSRDSWMNENGKETSFSDEDISKENGRFFATIDGERYRIRLANANSLLCYNANNDSSEVLQTYTRVAAGGHSVLAYDVEEPEEEKRDRYRYRISICDPNKKKFTYMYVSEDYKEWYYLYMSLLSEENGTNRVFATSEGEEAKIMFLITADINIIDIINPETKKDRSVLRNYNRNFLSNYDDSIHSVSSSEGTSATISGMSANGNLEAYILPNIGETANGTASGPGMKTIFLPDGNDASYTVTPKNDKISSSAVFENYLVGAKTSAGESATFDPSGKVSLKGEQSDYQLELTFNEGKNELPWFTLVASGSGATMSSLENASDGMILKSDNLKSVSVQANNRKDNVSVAFSTEKDSVKFMAKDRKTLGVYTDEDDDGTYETLIADSSQTPGPSNPSGDAPSDDGSEGDDLGKLLEDGESQEPQESGMDFYSTSGNASVSSVSTWSSGIIVGIIILILLFGAGIVVLILLLQKNKKNN